MDRLTVLDEEPVACEIEIGGMVGQRIFNVPDLVATDFEPATAERMVGEVSWQRIRTKT